MSNTLTSGMPEMPKAGCFLMFVGEAGRLSFDAKPGYDAMHTDDALRAYGLACFNAGRAEGGKDAERYRWLRNEAHPDREDTGLCVTEHDFNDWGKSFHSHYSGARLDSKIDAVLPTPPAAMTKEKP